MYTGLILMANTTKETCLLLVSLGTRQHTFSFQLLTTRFASPICPKLGQMEPREDGRAMCLNPAIKIGITPLLSLVTATSPSAGGSIPITPKTNGHQRFISTCRPSPTPPIPQLPKDPTVYCKPHIMDFYHENPPATTWVFWSTPLLDLFAQMSSRNVTSRDPRIISQSPRRPQRREALRKCLIQGPGYRFPWCRHLLQHDDQDPVATLLR